MNKFELEKLNITIYKEQNIAHLLTTKKRKTKQKENRRKRKNLT